MFFELNQGTSSFSYDKPMIFINLFDFIDTKKMFSLGHVPSKFFRQSFLHYRKNLECLPMSGSFTLVYYLVARLGSQPVELNPVRNSTLVSSSLAANTSLGWKRLTLANALACHNTVKVTAVKRFTVHAPVWVTFAQ
jgi:hypothetical protein